jgi:hypothetical protein
LLVLAVVDFNTQAVAVQVEFLIKQGEPQLFQPITL